MALLQDGRSRQHRDRTIGNIDNTGNVGEGPKIHPNVLRLRLRLDAKHLPDHVAGVTVAVSYHIARPLAFHVALGAPYLGVAAAIEDDLDDAGVPALRRIV